MDVCFHMGIVLGLLMCQNRAFGQLPGQVESENNCFNGIMQAECSQTTERAFVKELIAGVKFTTEYSTTNTSMCPPYWTATVLPECCERGPSDCYGEYNAVSTDPYVFYKDCVGKRTCVLRAAVNMDTDYLNCDRTVYPAQTTYFYINFYCIDISRIGSLTSTNKQNDGQGSWLYLWSGSFSDYQELPASTHTCSMETDCEETITVTSLDFRFSGNDANSTCLEGKNLEIADGSVSNIFNCSTSANNFRVQTLYVSQSNYITLTYTGTTVGGYLWLALQAKGNLSLNCPPQDRINMCESSTTTETTEEPTTTTEIETTTKELLTTTIESTTSDEPTTTMEVTTTETSASTEELTTDNATSLTDTSTGEDPEGSSSPEIIAAVVSVCLILIIVGLVVYLYRRYRQKRTKKKNDEENLCPQSNSYTDGEAKNKSLLESDQTPTPQLPPINTMIFKENSTNVSKNGILNNSSADGLKSEQNNTKKLLHSPSEEVIDQQQSEKPSYTDALLEKHDIFAHSGFQNETENLQSENPKKKKKKKKKKKEEALATVVNGLTELEQDNDKHSESNNEQKVKKKKKKRRREITSNTETMTENENREHTITDDNVDENTKKDVNISFSEIREERSPNLFNSNNEGIEHTEEFNEGNKDESETKKKKKKKKHKKRLTDENNGDTITEFVDYNNKNTTGVENEKKKKKKKRKSKVYPSDCELETAKTHAEITV